MPCLNFLFMSAQLLLNLLHSRIKAREKLFARLGGDKVLRVLRRSPHLNLDLIRLTQVDRDLDSRQAIKKPTELLDLVGDLALSGRT
jgi:hypothetical protein